MYHFSYGIQHTETLLYIIHTCNICTHIHCWQVLFLLLLVSGEALPSIRKVNPGWERGQLIKLLLTLPMAQSEPCLPAPLLSDMGLVNLIALMLSNAFLNSLAHVPAMPGQIALMWCPVIKLHHFTNTCFLLDS